ncbi:MAG: hypothetical protein JWN73_4612 [Betaproteobacteria bacterium]|nr:hypothetical protein [Betaproteobacteria bacterium]
MLGKLFGTLIRRDAAQSAPADSGPSLKLLAQIKDHLQGQGTIMSNLLMQNILAQPEHHDPKRLERHGWKAYSQNDEDGILQEIFRRIGAPHKSFVEFGCGDCMENNTAYLLSQGWRGLWLDADDHNANNARNGFGHLMAHGLLQFTQAMVSAENIDSLIAAANLGPEIDLLSIDIDGNDQYVWQAIHCTSARVVAIEYNAKFHPPHPYTVSYDPALHWDETDRVGSSLAVFAGVGASLGYQLVGCNLTGSNAFFVRRDLAADLFAAPATAEHLYQPARYFLTPYFSSGHKVNHLTVVESAARCAGLPPP